jgi:hypothetical protein
MAEVYMAILLEETLTLYQRLQRKFLKINIGSKVNTNAITEANFKLQKDLMGFTKKSIPNNPLHNSTIAHFK